MTTRSVSIEVSELNNGENDWFLVEVTLPGPSLTKYTVRRSVDSFLKLHSNLCKIFPNTKMPESLRSQRDHDSVTRRSSFSHLPRPRFPLILLRVTSTTIFRLFYSYPRS